jgi:hypothetical protein
VTPNFGLVMIRSRKYRVQSRKTIAVVIQTFVFETPMQASAITYAGLSSAVLSFSSRWPLFFAKKHFIAALKFVFPACSIRSEVCFGAQPKISRVQSETQAVAMEDDVCLQRESAFQPPHFEIPARSPATTPTTSSRKAAHS